MRASARPRARKSAKAVTADILAALMAACASERLVDVRDRAILLTAFASGGRRRSEVATLRVEQIEEQDAVPADPKQPDVPTLPCLQIRLGRTKTAQADTDSFVLLVGRPVAALVDWLERAGITEGAVFRRIDHWGNLERRALSALTGCVRAILPRRPARESRCPRPCSNHSIAPSNRPRTITTTPRERWEGRRV